MMRTLLCSGLLAFSALSLPAHAAGPAVYPVKQLIGYVANGEEKLLIDPVFIEAIQQKGPAFFVSSFENEFRQQFGKNAAATINSANRMKTFAASLQLTRASHYQVPGLDNTVTHFFPVTVSLNITNPLTGEIVYTTSKTRYELLKVLDTASAEEVHTQQLAMYEGNLLKLISSVVAEAAKNFRPQEVSAGLSREWNGLYVLDKGLDAGIAPGDDLQDAKGNLIKVVHSGSTYAAAIPVLVGKLDSIPRFSRYTTMSVNDIKKPRMLILPDARRQDGGDDVINELFSQLLARDTAFTLTPVNRNYQQVLNALDRETELGQAAVKQNRALPDFFIRLHTAPRTIYELPTNSASVVHRLYETMAFGEVLDGSGRVVFATSADASIDDEIVKGAGFDVGARYEVLLKNVVQELADKFSKGVQIRNISAAVARVEGGRVTVDDPSRALDVGVAVRIFHKLDQSGAEALLVPVWEARVVERRGQQVDLELVLPQTSAMQKNNVQPEVGDVVLARTAGKGAAEGMRIEPCDVDRLQHGSYEMPSFGLFAYYSFAENSPFPFYTWWRQTRDSIDQLTRFAGFRAPLKMQEPLKAAYCLQPASKIELTGRTCNDKGLCSVKVSAQVAFGIKGPKDAKPRYFGQKIEPVINNVPEDYLDEVINSQLMKQLPAVFLEGARRIGKENWAQ